MRSARLRKFLVVLVSGGFLYGSVSCYPNRDQINGTIASGLMNGIELALTLAVENLFTNAVNGVTDTTTQTQDETQTTN